MLRVLNLESYEMAYVQHYVLQICYVIILFIFNKYCRKMSGGEDMKFTGIHKYYNSYTKQGRLGVSNKYYDAVLNTKQGRFIIFINSHCQFGLY